MKKIPTGSKFAVFDIDGTLYRWQLYHELAQRLSLDGVFPKDLATNLEDKWNSWRAGVISFGDYEGFVVSVMVENLPKVSVKAFEDACDKVVEQSAHKTHFYPRELIKKLKQQEYKIVAITGSQQELIDRFGKLYDFDVVVGSRYERKDGMFTGATEVMTIGRKPEILREVVKTYGLSWAGSLAIGDSDGDAGLLEMVENPIAFNPSEGLFERAKHEGWPIVVERKNIAYRLEKQYKELILVETIVYKAQESS